MDAEGRRGDPIQCAFIRVRDLTASAMRAAVRRKVRCAVCLSMLAAGVWDSPESRAAEPGGNGAAAGASPAELLAQIQDAMARVRTTYAEFEQERKLDLFDEPIRTEGVMVFEQPGRVRWETTSPYRSILLSDGKAVAQFEWTEGRWQKLQVGFPRALRQVLDQVAAIHGGRVDVMKRDYEVSAAKQADGIVLPLVPRSPGLRRSISSIELTLALDLTAARGMILKEPNGDYTRIAFRNERRDRPLPDGTFDLASPVELKMIRERVHGGGG
jgi:hypothetical protein